MYDDVTYYGVCATDDGRPGEQCVSYRMCSLTIECVLLLSADLVSKLLTVDPKKRATTADVLKHPWIVSKESNNSRCVCVCVCVCVCCVLCACACACVVCVRVCVCVYLVRDCSRACVCSWLCIREEEEEEEGEGECYTYYVTSSYILCTMEGEG